MLNTKKKLGERELQFSTGGCRLVSFHVTFPVFTRLWQAFVALFFWRSFSSFIFFFCPSFSLQLALSFWRCYFSVTKFTFHTFITFGSCN